MLKRDDKLTRINSNGAVCALNNGQLTSMHTQTKQNTHAGFNPNIYNLEVLAFKVLEIINFEFVRENDAQKRIFDINMT